MLLELYIYIKMKISVNTVRSVFGFYEYISGYFDTKYQWTKNCSKIMEM